MINCLFFLTELSSTLLGLLDFMEVTITKKKGGQRVTANLFLKKRFHHRNIPDTKNLEKS